METKFDIDLQYITDALNINLSSITHSNYLSLYNNVKLNSVDILFSLDKKSDWKNKFRFIACSISNNGDNTFAFKVFSKTKGILLFTKLRKKNADRETIIKYLTDSFKNIVEKSL